MSIQERIARLHANMEVWATMGQSCATEALAIRDEVQAAGLHAKCGNGVGGTTDVAGRCTIGLPVLRQVDRMHPLWTASGAMQIVWDAKYGSPVLSAMQTQGLCKAGHT